MIDTNSSENIEQEKQRIKTEFYKFISNKPSIFDEVDRFLGISADPIDYWIELLKSFSIEYTEFPQQLEHYSYYIVFQIANANCDLELLAALIDSNALTRDSEQLFLSYSSKEVFDWLIQHNHIPLELLKKFLDNLPAPNKNAAEYKIKVCIEKTDCPVAEAVLLANRVKYMFPNLANDLQEYIRSKLNQ